MIEQIRNMRRINPELEVAGVLPTMTYRDELQAEKASEIRARLAACQIRTFNNIRRSALVDRSTFLQDPLVTASPKSKTLRDYRIFTKRLIGDGMDDTAEGGEQ
jgi:cellulose biosynthesis protein BcsQ